MIIKSRYYILQIWYENSVMQHFYLKLYLEYHKFLKIGSSGVGLFLV